MRASLTLSVEGAEALAARLSVVSANWSSSAVVSCRASVAASASAVVCGPEGRAEELLAAEAAGRGEESEVWTRKWDVGRLVLLRI